MSYQARRPDPTPEEIASRSEAIRGGWTLAEEQHRLGYRGERVPHQRPAVPLSAFIPYRMQTPDTI